MTKSFHESYDRPELPLPSDRSTGLVFTVIALIVAYLWRSNSEVLFVAISVAGTLAIISLAAPKLLRPLNVAWMRFAHLLAKVMNPIVMFILFAITIIPAGLLMQIWRDPMRRQRSGNETSYWIARPPDEQMSMKNQF